MEKTLLHIGNGLMIGGGMLALSGIALMAFIQNCINISIPIELQNGVVMAGILIACAGYVPAYLGSKDIIR